MAEKIVRIHFDLIGGIAGDMFVAAVASAFPELGNVMIQDVKQFPESSKRTLQLIPFDDGTLNGLRFEALEHTQPHSHSHAHDHHHDDNIDHGHVHYSDICILLKQSNLHPEVMKHALNLFSLLAEAEGQVHGIEPEQVTFHEVGAWDSIMDFLAAAYFIHALGPVQWTFSALPLGGGTVKTAHGVLPVPAPATTLLMKGIPIIDDGIQGERVTPTGATLVKYLLSISNRQGLAEMSISHCGNGFGSKKLPNTPNVLRCLAFSAQDQIMHDERISVITFEIDDQTAEDLAIGIDTIRQHPAVIEVYQAIVYGKKGRLLTQLQILAMPDSLESVCELCFIQTSTLGLRIADLGRKVLNRSIIPVGEAKTRVKVVKRPNNQTTAKAEIDDIAAISSSMAQRLENKFITEQRALKQINDE